MHRVQSRDFMDIDKLPSADGIGVLEIRALGRLQLQIENRIISAFPTRKAEELLAFLLYFYGTPHKRERLIEMLWPGVRPDVGRSRLSTTLWRVRGLLENLGLIPNHYLESTGDSLTLSIHPQTFFDVQAFVSRIEAASLTADEAEMASHLTAAEELWCGELFEGIYADWCLIERERLNRLRMRGLGKLVAHHFDAGQYDEAINQIQRALNLEPNFLIALAYLGWNYIAKHQYEDAIRELQKAVRLSGQSSEYLGLLSYAYSLAGKKGDALEVLGKLKEIGGNRFVDSSGFIYAYIGLGDKEKAIEYLQKSFETRDYLVLPVILPDRIFDDIRSDPRFEEIVEKMNLPQP